VVNNVRYTNVYRTNYYGGRAYYGYVPAYYYGPAYYGWAYNPWAAPVYYNWGWYGNPWYRPYGYYFAPAPYYPVASLWLTDYLLAESLRSGYEAREEARAQGFADGRAEGRAEANADVAQVQDRPRGAIQPYVSETQPAQGGGATVLTPEVKQMIAEEVKSQLAAEQAAAANPQQPAVNQNQAPAALDPAHRVFVVASNLDLDAGDGNECALTSGDVITRISDTPDANNKATVLVTSSKKSDCAAGLQLAVGVEDLQEMHNRFREHLDAGLKTLADNQGKNGLPKAPDTRTRSGEVPPPPPDSGVDAKLQAQQAEADQAEADAQKEAGAGQGGQ